MTPPINRELAMAERIFETLVADIFRASCDGSPTYEITSVEGIPVFSPECPRAKQAISFALAASHEFYNSRGFRELASE